METSLEAVEHFEDIVGRLETVQEACRLVEQMGVRIENSSGHSLGTQLQVKRV